ncbi:protocadherin Fat 2 [Anguilla anguilla]|uniref:protocadherin Fat 2 n=1 Tax=Anguilla anguilla TaxID=7936 RepID=UPI0015B2AFBA|nr:protocadherin Fat 2 [Anguilla anguilla]XP_035265582.1 protocadherin Fat 2 [Anguilla anguilla]
MGTTEAGVLLAVMAISLHIASCHRSLVKGYSPLSFTHHLYNATIYENSAPRTYVESAVKMGIVVTDDFWDIKYKLVAGDEDNLFKTEEVTVGDFCFLRIKTRSSNSASLNREVRDSYTLTIEASESTYDYQARTKVLIRVLDTNDLKPLFYPASYNVIIKEDTALKTSVVQVSATDADISSNADFYYIFISRSHPFAVDPFTGTITLIKKLDHSRARRYELTVLAEDRTKKISGIQKFGNEAKVVVNVEKVSAKPPIIKPVTVIPQKEDDDLLSLNVAVKAGVKEVEALNIVAGDPQKYFETIPSSLEFYNFEVVNTRKIDWSHSPFGFNISLQAKDRNNPPILSLINEIYIPPRKHAPLKFEKEVYHVMLSEFAPPKSHVVRVMVTPNHANVTYHIRNSPKGFKFKISHKTGQVVTTEHVDFETKSYYEFDVVANHGEAHAHVIVDIIDENDNAPKFTSPSYQGTLPENVPIGTSILTVTATDGDIGNNGFVTYAIANTGPLPFTVDPFTGVISTSEEMDYELMQRWYHLRVWASDSGSPFSHVSECAVTLIMSNVDDNVPLFERVGCNATIPLDFAVGETIGIMSAVDLDELQQVRYSIESGNERALFNIDPVSGSIRLAKEISSSLSAGEKPSFRLNITATDGIHSAVPTVVSITVTGTGSEPSMQCQEMEVFKQLTERLIQSIKPEMTQEEDTFSDIHIINRHSPKFEPDLPSSMDLREDFPLNTTILHFRAMDADTGFNGKLVYAISSGSEDGCFIIDMETGELKLICPLDRETKAFYILNITIYDLGVPQTSAWKFLAVNILDANDNPPIFDQCMYVLSIPENTEVDKSIFKVHAVDYDLDDNGSIKYSLLTSTETFKIDKLTGVLKVAGQLDRETNPRHDLKIEARDQAKVDAQLLSTVDVVVVLEDINDSPPKFVPKVYKIQVPEDVPLGTVLLWVESYDLDLGAGGEISYNLKNTENGAFFIDTSTGCLTLEKELDFERKQFYNLTVRAVDHGQPRSLSSSCFIEVKVLDVNENLNAPAFSSFVYKVPVMEDAAVGTSVVTLTAVDRDLGKDGVVRYHIHDGTGLGIFTIDEETGVIRTAETLDREAISHYWLTVYAADLGTIPLVSWTEVFVEVMDINDNPPELSQPIYFGSVLENSPKGKSVLKVEATDADLNSEEKLTFQTVDTQRMFSINTKTGVITTQAVLDREQKAEHIIEVIVSDNGTPALRSTGTVVIQVLDENDNSPQFSHKLFQVKLPERQGVTEPQEVYRMVVRDDDEGPNAEVTFSLENDLEHKFNIHPTTGVVSSKGDFGHGNYTILTIKATDHGSPARKSTARLDIEWIPKPMATSETLAFDEPHFNFAVMEMDPVNHMVGIISTDRIGSLLWFDIIGGDDELDFDIEKDTGTIMIARRLDAAKRSSYNLTVRVTDGSQTITTQAYIRVVDMNGHRPTFLKSQYEVRVPEDTAPWKDILQISAEDKDFNSRLLYTIHSSIQPESIRHFQLDPNSGVLVIKEKLDYETLPVHTLIFMVRDQEIPMKRNFVKAVVYVEDCNDHSPVFMSSRYEANVLNLAAIGTEVLQTKALDKDTGSNAEIVYSFHSGNTEGAFSIDPQTGHIKVAKPLDTLSQEQYHLTVKATDQGFPQRSDLSPVNIHVKLSEKTPPKFSSNEYFTEISESTPKGSPFFTVTASSSSAVHYKIKGGDPNGTFHINYFSGVLSIQSALNFEERFSYRLQIRASSLAGSYSDAVVNIYVIDENDNSPVFLQEEFVGQISESAHINSMVMGKNNTPLVIQATDADSDANALLAFQILEPEVQKVFKIDPSMGTLSIITPIDFELTPEIHFTVQVRDSGEPSLYASKPAKVTVHVLDFNDCFPKFTAPLYESSIMLPAFHGMEAIQVTADDADSDVSYSIYEGNFNNAFSIDPTTGIISVDNASNLKLNYKLFVKASDGLFKDTAIVKINTTNITMTGLRFEQKFYAATVMENTTSVKTLAVVRASGSYLNEPLLYTVLNPGGLFSVIQTSGVLETTGVPFDREKQDVYDVAVEVRDFHSPPRIALANVKVYINDANDNAPQFLNLPYSIMISDDAEPGDVLFQVTATDKDLGENGSITYLLEDDFDLFRIDPYLGDVSLQRPLDYESKNRYVLSVLAEDEGMPSLASIADLQIQVKNRSNPVFQSLYYPLRVPENISPFTTILHVQARNPEGYRLIYNLIEENASRTFHIDFKTGVLSVTDNLDYEAQTKHVLTVRATDSVIGAFSDATVGIEVEDINDNAPEFQQLSYTANVLEGLPIGTSVLQISAVDKDSGRNKAITYQIAGTGKNESDFFEIDPQSGLLVTTQELDYEDIQQFRLIVKAIDHGVPPMTSEAFIIVNVTDVNDNPPKFSKDQYHATLNEMATCGHIVIRIQASDPDSGDLNNLDYTILSGNEDRHFAINRTSGIISFSNVCKKSLDPFYNLTVAVSDGIFQKTAPVNIDMMNSNKHNPHFDQSIYEAELAENAEAGTRVIRLAAIDPDDGPYGSVDYTIINKLADEKFSIDNEGQIVTSQPLDRENPTQRVIAIKVMAKDGGGRVGFCTVKIILTDENDNAPQFKASEYQVSIQSSVNKGSPVIQIMAYDADDGKNADVTYTVDEAEEVTEEVIEINPFTGVISTKESLVGMENKIFNFKIKARDGGIPFYNSTVPVQVKVVSPKVPLPRFSEPLYTFSAAEDLPLGSEIGVVKADADTPIIYSLVDGNTVESNKEQVFGVDKDSGALFVQKGIDYEKTKWYQIDVMANCNRNGTDVASLVSVSIQVQDVNDNHPVFEANPYQAFLAENMPPGTTVIQVTANDPDMETNGEVTYRVEPDPDDISEVFTIDSESGWITTLKETDCETTRLYRFHVVATDHGGKVKLSSSVLVEVIVTDENDNPPQFSEEVYQGSVIENSRPGVVITTMSIMDADVSKDNRWFACYITDGDPQDLFSIVQVGEEWKVTLKGSLDRETKERYGLKIVATDGRFQASATVDVHVLDINDNSPLCEQLLYTEVIMENSPPGVFILKVSASDPDIGTNGQVSFTLHGPNADKFHLDPQTGELFTLAVLDREQEVEYDLVAKATDGGGRSCQADVLLMIQDINDNPPRFSTNHYDVTVFDNTTVRTPIAVIYAKDPDTGINSEVVYSLLGPDSRYFSLDEFSGILRLERSLSDESQSRFELKVQATDRGLPHRRSSIATVTVSVVDLKDYQPVFLSNEYTAQIPESTAVGTEILSVSALAKDATDNVPITYDIISGNEHGKFEIDTETGALYVNGSLDFEHCREYYLSVEGARGKSSLSDIAMVIINITDINDNAPAFSLGDYSKEISEDISPGDTVMQVSADDLDGPLNNLVRYSIVSGDPERQFSIDPRSGEIRAIRRLDREEVTHYSLTVQAADSGHPPLSTAVQVTVTVSDVNDNPPVFSKNNHSVVLQEGEPVGSSILQLTVTDRDTPRNGPPFSFHILSGNEDKRFHIDQGGLLSIAGPLRKRTKGQHLLKIQVTDSGHPPLSSICVVRINVTEQSKYPPAVVPLDVFITTTDGAFSSRVIGKLHATDQDLHDVLSYKLGLDSQDSVRFSVDPTDGKIVAQRALEPGLYFLNVSVSDGKFSAWAGVRVHVWGATQQDLDRGVTLQLAGLTPEEFVTDHWRAMQRSLGAGLHVASLQQEPGSSDLEVLLVWRNAEPLLASQLARVMENDMGIRVTRVRQESCVGVDCPPRGCRNTVRVTDEWVSHYTSARTGFITPRHTWESVCFCNESAVKFDGNGYLKFLYQADAEKQGEQDFQLSLRMKTFQEHSLVMSTNGTDWGSLEVVGGELRFRYGCGNEPPGTLRAQAGPVSDGRWHHVLLELRGTELKLTLDRAHPNVVTLAEPCRMTRPGGALTFAAPWAPHGEGRPPGFRGCLGEVEFNGEAVRGTEGAGERGLESQAGDRRVFGLYQCCSQIERCADHPCQNGGTCVENSNGEFRCSCTPQYFGSHCEQANNPCSSQPCAHGGVCQPKAQGYSCSCPEHSTGSRCQNVIDTCSPNPCPNGYDCKIADGLMHCDPLPQVSGGIGMVEIVEIAASALGIVFLVGVFVCIRKRYVQRKKQKQATARDSNGYYPPSMAKRVMVDGQQTSAIEMSMLAETGNDLDHDPFRTLKPRGQTELVSRGGNQAQKAQGPVVCSVAPNLPPPPPSSSDNESILKNNWELDYDVYPADPDYFGRPTVQEFPQFDIVEGTFSPAPPPDPRRSGRFGGFPFPLDRCDRRAPLPPCYSNQNLDDFLGPDGQPLPAPQCPNEYTAISYYPVEHARSVDNVSAGNYRRLSMRLSVAQPSYADSGPPPQGPPSLPEQGTLSYAGSDMVESDYGSCEEVMF